MANNYTPWDINEYLPGEPLTSSKAISFHENLDAAFEGATGAPRLEDSALDTTVTNAGRDWVLNRTALGTAGAVGTYAMLATSNSTVLVTFGQTIAGSQLEPAGLYFDNPLGGTRIVVNGSVTGTWRCVGFKNSRISNNTSNRELAMFLRIS